MKIEHAPVAREAETGHDWRAQVGERNGPGLSADLERAREPGRGREAETPAQIPARGWQDLLWRVVWSISADRILSTSGGVAFFALVAIFPGIAALVSLYGLFADTSTMGNHLTLLSGILPGGVLALVADQITLIARQGNETLGAAFAVGLLVALVSANSGVAALFDALNVVYDEKEKRSLVCFYATTLLFTLAGIVFVSVGDFGRGCPAAGLEIHGLGRSHGMACKPPAMADPSPHPRGEPRLHLPLWPEPARCSLAVGDLG
jgi:membrane protein